MFDPSWFLILASSSPQIDAALTKQTKQMSSPSSLLSATHLLRNTLRGNPEKEESVFLPPEGLDTTRISPIPFSASRIAQREGSSKIYVLDSVSCLMKNAPRFTADIRLLASKLAHSDPITFGLLKCSGVLRQAPAPGQTEMVFTFVFRVFQGFSTPSCLRARLLAGEADHSLSERLDVAKQLAKSISYIHTFGFVHKNVCPENILVSKEKPSALGRPFLVGFEEFRTATGNTGYFGAEDFSKNLYRHPDRQGRDIDSYYVMQHDIYSLGVCLLELGLFKSFVTYSPDGKRSPSPLFAALFGLGRGCIPVDLKDLLISMSKNDLPKCMGTKYARVVETCLTCLDRGNADFGDEREFQDTDGVLVGVRYIEKVLLQLDDISM